MVKRVGMCQGEECMRKKAAAEARKLQESNPVSANEAAEKVVLQIHRRPAGSNPDMRS
jgi:hypothetical protein